MSLALDTAFAGSSNADFDISSKVTSQGGHAEAA
jgi:hypothetical protein